MSKAHTSLVALTMFAFGCAASAVVVQVIPPAHAQAANPRWEYFCMNDVDRPWKAEYLAKLNYAGNAGWELVNQLHGRDGANGDVFCFKRRLP